MRVGLSILTHSGHNIWNNGIAQNVYFLAKCLETIPFIERVFIINCGDQDVPPADSGDLGARYPLIDRNDALGAVDIAIEVSGALGETWKNEFKARGGRIIFHNCGQPYAALMEPHIFGKSGCFGQPEMSDEVWLLPKDKKFTAMQRAIHRCDVFEVPYLWAPDFLIDSGSIGPEIEFGYKAGSLAAGQVRAAIFEPNISPLKMGIIPLFICEEIERRRPDLIDSVRFLNGNHMLAAHTFSCMVENLNLTKASKLTIAGREYFSDVMKSGANLVISHQLEVPQNYVYLDALYGQYPLVHNSEMFADVGYYYRHSDIEEAVELVDWLVQYHDLESEAYNAKAKRKIDSLNPDAPRNRDVYARRLLALRSNSSCRMVRAS